MKNPKNAEESEWRAREMQPTSAPLTNAPRKAPGSAAKKGPASARPGLQPSASAQSMAVFTSAGLSVRTRATIGAAAQAVKLPPGLEQPSGVEQLRGEAAAGEATAGREVARDWSRSG
eukprot:CAMPEP_0179950436 /NCGR_PEP_ID=MMETSP0983-20121128/22938_1 /TAXON_ID=483367 /ORGANISM="non described non described, Strain CCMP 2436" /LENGTH=117 /DNA_ID=CAMNT_0021860383 /DNA_START=45 /DNA_END=394 /DNA_ORIENTATION=-